MLDSGPMRLDVPETSVQYAQFSCLIYVLSHIRVRVRGTVQCLEMQLSRELNKSSLCISCISSLWQLRVPACDGSRLSTAHRFFPSDVSLYGMLVQNFEILSGTRLFLGQVFFIFF